MNENNVIPFQPIGPFSREARERWNKIPKWAQVRILENVWCVGCRDETTIILESAQIEGRNLVLSGKCKAFGHEVCRVVEPENE